MHKGYIEFEDEDIENIMVLFYFVLFFEAGLLFLCNVIIFLFFLFFFMVIVIFLCFLKLG